MNENTIEHKKSGFFSKPWVQSATSIIVIFGVLAGFIYWQYSKNSVFVENSQLQAPMANISSTASGVLNAIYVKDGDKVTVNQAIALIGSETIYAKEEGLVSGAPLVVGGYYTPGQTIATIIANNKMRVVGSIDETKGLEKIASGQHVTFTVDAFGGKTYEGVVDEVSSASNDTGVAFSISDKRPIKKFNIYVSFDTTKYPELKSGMSAKITINTKK